MIPTHITLVPPTDVSGAELVQIEGHLADVADDFAGFAVHLRGTGTFRPVSPVVFVTLVEGISQCEQLAAAVRRGPLDVPLDFPYHPHVTIAHHLGDEQLDQAFRELAAFECEFAVGDFHLYVHDEALGWQPTSEFCLQDTPRAVR
jgi:2'-5' RNA ligase